MQISNQMFTNALTDASPFAEQPVHCQTPLRPHQLAALESMKEKELGFQRGFPLDGQLFFSKVAILGDGIGTGKTLTTLGHISQMATYPLTPESRHPLSNLHPASTSACFSINPTNPETTYDSLIVVPHTIYRQWQDAIEEHTSLRAHFLKSQRDLDKDSLLTSLQTSHCTLISNTLLPMFLGSLRAREIVNPVWRRVFYDEADTIRINGNVKIPQANINWLITSTPTNLLFTNEYFMSVILTSLPQDVLDCYHPELRDQIQIYIDNHPNVTFFRMQSWAFFKPLLSSKHPLRGVWVVKSSKAFLNESIHLPPLTQTTIRCQPAAHQDILEYSVPPEVNAMLHAGDIQGALQTLGVSSHSPMTIVDAVTQFHTKEKTRLERLYSFKEQEEYATEAQKQFVLLSLQERIQNLSSQIQDLRRRVEQATKESCSICFEDSKEPVLVPCCSKQFCGKCIISWLSRTTSCPLCRAGILPKQLRYITPNPTQPRAQLPRKVEVLQKLLQENPDGHFLIFSKFENPLEELQQTLDTNYPSAVLHGNKNSVANMLEDFESGKLRILLIDSKLLAAGINLPTATHLILLHKLPKEEEKQILGRAYRMGRAKPLQFIKLLHQRE